jgi:hypothetical protein
MKITMTQEEGEGTTTRAGGVFEEVPHVIDASSIDALDRTIEMMFSHSTTNVDYDDVRDSLIMNRKRLSLPNANGGGHLRQYTTSGPVPTFPTKIDVVCSTTTDEEEEKVQDKKKKHGGSA